MSFIMKIIEEEGTISSMSQELSVPKGDVVILALNLLYHVLEQRKAGKHLTTAKGEDKTADILKEAVGEVKFKLND